VLCEHSLQRMVKLSREQLQISRLARLQKANEQRQILRETPLPPDLNLLERMNEDGYAVVKFWDNTGLTRYSTKKSRELLFLESINNSSDVFEFFEKDNTGLLRPNPGGSRRKTINRRQFQNQDNKLMLDNIVSSASTFIRTNFTNLSLDLEEITVLTSLVGVKPQ
jgi:hypothetical protein